MKCGVGVERVVVDAGQSDMRGLVTAGRYFRVGVWPLV